MLSKCANPTCSATFRYLREGKLFVIDLKTAAIRHRSSADKKSAGETRALEYVWLCSLCYRELTIQANDNLGIRVVCKSEALTNAELYSSVPAPVAGETCVVISP